MFFRKAIVAVALALGSLTIATPANAATPTGTVNAPTVTGSNFTYSCDVNPGGSTIYVTGRSWLVSGGSLVDTSRQAISGTTPQHLTFTRDGVADSDYRYRCVWFADATTQTQLGRTASTIDVHTNVDAILGASVGQGTGETFSQALAREDSEYGPKVLRVFYGGLPSTSATDSRNAISRPVVYSFKDSATTVSSGADDATLNAWLDVFSNKTSDTWFSYYHEPEDNFTTATTQAQYRAAFQHFADLVHAKNNPKVHTTVIYMDWTFDSGSGRNWTAWYPGDAYVDYFSADMYGFQDTDSNTTAYQSLSDHLVKRNWPAIAKAHGKPLMVPELGFNQVGSRPEFLHSVGPWARANAVQVIYFDSTGSLGDHRLLDSASQTAWKQEIALT